MPNFSKLNQKKFMFQAPPTPPPPGNVQVQAQIKFLEQNGFGLEPWKCYEKVRKNLFFFFFLFYLCLSVLFLTTDQLTT